MATNTAKKESLVNTYPATSGTRRGEASHDRTSAALGQVVFSPDSALPPEIICQEGALRRHAARPWFEAYIARQLGSGTESSPVPAAGPAPGKGMPALAPDWALARHCLICGSSGGGKSMLCECLFCGMVESGQSCVVLDPKLETITRLAARAKAAGLAPDQITVISPQAGSIPGWNPFLAGLPPAQAAADFVALIERSATSWGVRLGDLLMNACVLAAAHKLSPYEMVECLRRDGYAETLLEKNPDGPPTAAYEEAADFFRNEFLAWTRSVRSDAVSAVTNKLRELLRSDFLRGLLCARENSLQLSKLWQRQHILLVHVDRTALGEEGARLLAGLLATSLFRTALRSSGAVPVNLMLDELATLEHFVGDTLIDIVTTARSYQLRLVAACQHLSALSPPLRSALLGNTAVQAFCRLGHEDARLVAASLAAGTTPRLVRLHADVAERDRRSGRPALATWKHVIRAASGLPLRMSPSAWERLCWDGLFGGNALATLFKHVTGAGRLYVRAANTGKATELRRYVEGLLPEEFWLEGPAPLTLVVGFPKPRLSGAQRLTEADAARTWMRALQDMPVQHAVLKIAGEAPVVMRVADMNAALPGDPRLLAETARVKGQSQAEIAETTRWRREQVTQAIQGVPPVLGAANGRRTPTGVDEQRDRNGKDAKNRRDTKKGLAGSNVPQAGGFADDGSLA